MHGSPSSSGASTIGSMSAPDFVSSATVPASWAPTAVAFRVRLPTATLPCLTTIFTAQAPGANAWAVKVSSLVPPPGGSANTSAPVPARRTFFMPTTWTASGRSAATSTSAPACTAPRVGTMALRESCTLITKSVSTTTLSGISAARWAGDVSGSASTASTGGGAIAAVGAGDAGGGGGGGAIAAVGSSAGG